MDIPNSEALYSQSSEEGVIGAILINPGAYYDVAHILTPNDFFIHRHRWVWEAIVRLNEQHMVVDFLTVTNELEQAGRLTEIGGPAYLAAVINLVPSSLHAESYARIIEQHSIRRRMLEAANQIAKLAYQGELSADTVLAESEQAVFNVSARLALREMRPLGRIIAGVYDRVEEAARSDGPLGLPSGFADLDRLTNGLQPSDMVVVAGRPGMGKTSFLLGIARHAAEQHGKRVAIFSLEMSGEQLAYRILAQQTGIDGQRLRTGKLTANEWTLLPQAIEQMEKTPIYVDDTPAITPTQLRSRCRRLYSEHGLDLVIVDYLQLMAGGARFNNRQEEVSYISRQIKTLAKELNIPVIAAAQLSRAVEQRNDKRPILSDLRESGSIEQDSDAVIFLYRPEGTNTNLVDIEVAKHRNGPTGSFQLYFQSAQTNFQNLAKGRSA